MLLALLMVLTSRTSSAAQASLVRASSSASAANVAVLDVVMLVDESGSETPAKVADEKQSAGTIAQSVLNPRSRVTVIGFGGVNNIVPDQNPVDVVCQPTVANGTANLGYLASCVNGLHRRTEAEGDDTDYAAALGQAMTYFNPDTAFGKQSPAGSIKVILLMTDGGVDVHRDTQQYGTDWMLGEQHAVAQQLVLARVNGVQVWPLGFGTDITPQAALYLSQLAKGGAQAACDIRQESQPHYQVVNNPANAVNALDTLYADAGCLGTSVTAPVAIGGGTQARTLKVTIPSFASSAAISVDRGNPSVQVSYQMQGGQQWSDSQAISGQGSPVEVLHLRSLTSDEAGTWTIRLSAAPGLAGQLAQATLFWQGAVRAVMTADPPNAELGQPISVTLSVIGPNGPITSPSALSDLQVGVRVSGDGQPGSSPVPVTNAGEAPSSPTGVGDYKGTFTAPKASGVLTFTGTVAGYGLYATKAPATVEVGGNVPGFTVTVEPPLVSSVQAGGAIRGQVTFVNQTGATRKVRLELNVSHALAAITSSSGPLTITSGSPPAASFTITFRKNSPIGSAWLEVKAIDDANPSIVYSDVPFTLTVTGSSGSLATRLWVIVVIVPLVMLFFLVRLWRRNADVRGLIAILRRDGEGAGPELVAKGGKWSNTFRFIVIRDSDQKPTELDYSTPGQPERAYTVRRTWSGHVRLRTPAGTRLDIVVDGPGEQLERDGAELAFRDTRPRRRPAQPAETQVTRNRGGVLGFAEQSVDQSTATTTPAPASQEDWI